jgi:GWxTD domain-containing protein
MMLKRLGWLCFLLGYALAAQAQWGLSVKNFQRPGTNVRLFLGYHGVSDVDKTFKVMVDFRLAGQGRVHLHKERILQVSGSDTVFLDLKLPAGRYEVDVEIEDRKANSYQSLSLPEPFRVHRSRVIEVSDIFIAPHRQWKPPFERPMLKAVVPYDQERLHYCLELNAPGYEVLTLRAVLYQESPSQNGAPTTAYQSLQQTNRVTYFENPGPVVFHDTLDLTSLPGGEYMIQVLVYDDDNFLLDEKTWFVKGGDIKQRIFVDLDNSIRMMRYLVPSKQLNELLETRDATVKRVEFLQIWEKLYDEQAEARMDAYFETIYAANDRYPEPNTPGWLTDRGRIFIQYGEPRVTFLQIGGKDHVRWTYARWALSFLFEKRNQAYFLVE